MESELLQDDDGNSQSDSSLSVSLTSKTSQSKDKSKESTVTGEDKQAHQTGIIELYSQEDEDESDIASLEDESPTPESSKIVKKTDGSNQPSQERQATDNDKAGGPDRESNKGHGSINLGLLQSQDNSTRNAERKDLSQAIPN